MRCSTIPHGWRPGKLEELVFFQRGFDITKAQQKPGTVPVISSSGITSYHDEVKVIGPGIVIGRKGTLGSIHFTSADYWPHDTTLWSKDLRGNDPKFIYYFLHTLDFKRFDVGNSNPTLNRNHIHDLPIIIPQSNIQRLIASILSTYDDLIENNRRRMALLEDAARQVYQEWFVRLRFPGYEHTLIVDGIPESWRREYIKNVGKVITGKTPKTNDRDNYGGDIPFIKTPDMHGNAYVVETETYLTDKGGKTQSGKFIPPNTILVSCIGAKLGAVSLTSCQSQFNQQINAVIPVKEAYTFFFYFACKDLKPTLEALGGGATMPNVNKSKFEKLTVILPSLYYCQSFYECCSPIFKQIQVLALQNQKLRTARDLLLPKLMSGEISV
jgi:type I restriction enzyme, S subunit